MKLVFLSFILSVVLIGQIRSEEEVTQSTTTTESHDSLNSQENVESKDNTMRNKFSSEWEQKMSDYEPDYVYMIPVAYKKREIYFENITKVPVKIRGAFLLDEEHKENIDFNFKNPSGQSIHRSSGSFDIFELYITEAGTYSVIFDNRYSNTDLKVTFTMSAAQNPILKKEDLSIPDEKVQSILKFLKSYSVSLKMRRESHYQRNRKSQEANKYFYTFSMLETIILVGLSVWQFYYMKQLVQTK